MEIQEIEDLIIRSLQEVKEILDVEGIGPLDSGTRIFGRQGLLDSMGLVSLIIDMEEKIEDEFGVPLILADERAMSQKKSPFLTVASMAQYISILMQEEKLTG